MNALPSAILQAELQAAREAERRESRLMFRELEGAGRWSLTDEDAAAYLELARERAAIQNEWHAEPGSVGLVSVPTTRKNRSEWRAQQASASLRAVLKATDNDQLKARVARMRMQVGWSARALGVTLQRPGFRDGYCAMVTLTYERIDQWKPCDLSRFFDNIRARLKADGIRWRYVWVAELQNRGAIHYHVGVFLPHGYLLPKPDESGWWPHGSSNIKAARDPVAYFMKYIQKADKPWLKLPGGARMHGSGGVEHTLKRARRWLRYPGWIKARADWKDDWRPAVGGGWSDPDGHVIPSEHTRAWVGDRWACVKVVDYGRPSLLAATVANRGHIGAADGPFSWLERGRA